MGDTDMRRRALSLVLALVFAPFLGGCLVGPNYERPQMPSPPQYRFLAGAPQAESLADAPWFQVFDDPALQALVKEAIANNLDLRMAIARVEEMRARAGIAKSYLYPQVDGVVSYNARQTSGVRGETTSGEDEDTTAQSGVYGFSLSWELDLFGRIRRGHESALAVVLATDQARRGVLVTLVGDVASHYFLLRELDLQLMIARRTLGLNDETVAYFQNRLDGGVANRLEVDRIRANRSQTAAAIPDIEQQIAVVENSLSLLLGRPPSAIPRQALTEAELLPPPIPPGLPVSLLERRPDIAQAEQMLISANADIGVAKAMFFPTISLTGFLGGVSGDLSNFLGGDGAAWSLGGRVAAADLSRQSSPAERRSRAGPLRDCGRGIPEGRAQRVPRSVDFLDHDPEAGGTARGGTDRRDRAPGRFRACPLAVRFRARQLHRDSHGRPGAVPAAADPRADARRGIARARGALSHARRRLAAIGDRNIWPISSGESTKRNCSSYRASSASCRNGSRPRACA